MGMVLEGGFSDPVLQSQQVFRAVMDALANPGKAQKLTTCHSIGRHLTPELVSIMLTFADHETPLWLGAGLHNTTGLLKQVGFLTGASVVDAPEAAAFAFAGHADELPALDRFGLGSQDYPDRSTTVVLAVPALEGGPDLMLRGPGIKDHIHCSPQGLMGDFVAQWAANRVLFPRGVDLLLVADGAVLGLPRSTRIAEGH